jgi:hypothetical protein
MEMAFSEGVLLDWAGSNDSFRPMAVDVECFYRGIVDLVIHSWGWGHLNYHSLRALRDANDL